MSRFSNLLYFSNIIISLSASCLMLFYALKSGENFHLTLPLLVFAATFIVYHLQRIGQEYFHQSLGEELKNFYAHFKYLVFFQLTLATFLIGFSAYYLSPRQWWVLIAGAILCAFYIKIPGSKFSLRSIPFSKPFVIALTWAISCSLLITNSVFYFIDCFIFILLLSIPFDLKDSEEDTQDGVITLANKFPKQLKAILIGSALVYSSFWIYHGDQYFWMFLISYSAIIFSKIKPWKYYLGLDGLIILRFIVYLYQY